MNFIEIPIKIENPASWYLSAFLISFLVRILFLIVYGRIKKFAQIPWLIFVAIVAMVFIIGSHLMAESIPVLLNADIITSGRTLIGGLLFAIPVALLLRKALGLSYDVFTPYAYTLPIGIAIQRIGCLAAGCCFGKPVQHSLIAIQYSPGSEAYNHHFASTGSILPFINVAPTQLYEIVGCLLLLIILFNVRNRFRSPGNLFIVSIVGYSVLRFFVEFSRDFSAHTLGKTQLWGLNSIQWILIFTVLVFSIWMIFRERNHVNKKQNRQTRSPAGSHWIPLGILITGIVIFYLGKQRLPMLESTAVSIALIIPLCFLLYILYLKIVISQLRWIVVVLIGSCFVLMSQTKLFEKDSTMVKKHILGLGVTGGWTELDYKAKDCSGATISSTSYNNKHYLTGGGYQYVVEYNSSDNIEIGSSFFYGKIREEADLNDIDRVETMLGISPYISINTRRLGIGGGVHLGDFSVLREFNYEHPVSSFDRFRMQPYIHFRYGNMNRFHMEFDYASQFPGPFPDNLYDLRFGFRPDPASPTRVMLGTSSYTSLYIKPNFRLNKTLNVEPYLGIGGGALNGYTTMGLKGGLSAHYLLSTRRINTNEKE